MLSQQRTLAFLMAFSLVMISPVFAHAGVRGIFLAACSTAVLLVVFHGKDLGLQRWFLLISVATVLSAFVPAFYWEDPRYILSPIFLVYSLFLLQLADGRAIGGFISIVTALMFVLLLGATFGFILALNGVPPLLDIPNGDGRPNYLFYTTFTNSWWGRIIRPAGIYDEPGAFSFMICGVAALRHIHGRDSRVTRALLGMGFVTLSLAHLVYVLFHAAAEKLSLRNIAGIGAILVPFILIVGYLGGGEIIEKRLLGRLSITETGEVVGDNRTTRFWNAVEHMSKHPRSILLGADPICRFDPVKCAEKYPVMGENPLSPLVMQGLFVSWPYYTAIAILFFAPFLGRDYVVAFGIGVLFLQRPYLLNLGYSLIGCLVVAVTLQGVGARRRHRHAAPFPLNLRRIAEP